MAARYHSSPSKSRNKRKSRCIQNFSGPARCSRPTWLWLEVEGVEIVDLGEGEDPGEGQEKVEGQDDEVVTQQE